MRVTHTVAAALVGILLIQSAALAQAPLEPVVRAVPREQAVKILLSNLTLGTEVRLEMSAGMQVVGRFVEKSDDELVVVVSGQRRVIPVAAVLSIRRPLPRGRTSDGGALAIGAAAGVGLLVTVIFVSAAASR